MGYFYIFYIKIFNLFLYGVVLLINDYTFEFKSLHNKFIFNLDNPGPKLWVCEFCAVIYNGATDQLCIKTIIAK